MSTSTPLIISNQARMISGKAVDPYGNRVLESPPDQAQIQRSPALRERHMKPETHNSVFLTADHMLSDPQLRGDTARGVTDALCSGLEGLNAGAGELERQRSKDGFL